MEFRIEFADDPPYVLVTTSGDADPEGFQAYLRDLEADPRFLPGTAMIVDHSALSAADVTSADVWGIAAMLRAFDEKHRPGPRAVVAPEPAKFGLTRMAHILMDADAERTAAFRTVDEALAWIREQT